MKKQILKMVYVARKSDDGIKMLHDKFYQEMDKNGEFNVAIGDVITFHDGKEWHITNVGPVEELFTD